MYTTEIAKLYRNLSLADADVDGEVLEIVEEARTDGMEDVKKCLVGKVKGLIGQIWSPFGQVEVELVGENTFMFYFINREDRNRVWQRGPWHFGNSLIVLEKPSGSGNISELDFNKPDFWVQIHDLPIMCMNRRSARWLAEQIGVTVEIPSESKECWGKYMRVKVCLDISKLLKRWLRLKLGKTDEVTMVGLRYERRPDFCYACGRIGHGMKECLDEDAKSAAIEGSSTKYGHWKSNARLNTQVLASSSEKLCSA
ncbi:hypothetical protein Ddye_015344 [Dipteronia dyeriana]|uniref:CCHC-type domain-containing protein n=1 Tax=Dipteronia dyeriana TaxID=168575 RepID=A0AAD9U4N4_9ROSI|nr:hypothetical protein Ddye_015344 [Dipteronia dyeriana]